MYQYIRIHPEGGAQKFDIFRDVEFLAQTEKEEHADLIVNALECHEELKRLEELRRDIVEFIESAIREIHSACKIIKCNGDVNPVIKQGESLLNKLGAENDID